jgi:hypothetical protein
MEKVVWKDATSYSRNQKERDPRVLKCMIGNIDVCVHRHIYYEGWLLSSNHLQIDKMELGSIPLEEAKEKALHIVYNRIGEKISKLQHSLSILKGILEKQE